MNIALLGTKGISIDRLRGFCAVVEAGSIVGAADKDPSRQSQLSRQIGELEEALAVKLFERVNRRLILTEAGRSVALMTRSYFEGLSELSARKAEGVVITIGAAESVLDAYVYPRLSGMRSAVPNCRFIFESCGTDEVVQGLKTGRIEIGILRENAATEFDTTALATVGYVLAVPRAILPQRHSGGLASLRGLPTAMLRGAGEFRRTFTTLIGKAGIDIQLIAETDTFGGIFQLVRTGTVAAILPQTMAKLLPADKFAVIESDDFAILERSLVVATLERTVSQRPLLTSATQRLASVWRP
jgi:DNA-binding transcriptional LysR family regulator